MSNVNAHILEIFPSVQGEGKYAGVPQVFVRFFECHMHCVWCDTPASIGDTSRQFKVMSLEDVFAAIQRNWRGCHSVSLTGGEPLMQKDFIRELLPLMKRTGMRSYLETSGVLYEALADIVDDVDIIAMDIKLPSSTQCAAFWREHEEFLKLAVRRDVFVKAVVSSETVREDIERAVDLMKQVDPQLCFILQPNIYQMQNGVISKCLEYQEFCLSHLPHTRVMPQMHKFMKLR